MLRVLRGFLNILMCLVLCVVLMFTQILVFDIIQTQAPDDIDPVYPFPKDDQIGMLDLFLFWGTDLGENLQQPAKYRVRTWVSAGWWYSATGWLDKTIDVVAGVTKPIIVPIAQINAVKIYNGRTPVDFILKEQLANIILNEGDYYEKFSKDNIWKEYYTNFLEYYTTIRPQELTKEVYDALILVNNEKNLGIEIPQFEEIKSNKDATKEEYGNWIGKDKQRRQIYNNLWKLNKYNDPVYDNYRSKFVAEQESGERMIKPAAVMLSMMFYVSLILAIVFTIKYPVSLIQARFAGKKRTKDIVEGV